MRGVKGLAVSTSHRQADLVRLPAVAQVERGGDLAIQISRDCLLTSYVFGTSHGSPYPYDRAVPLISRIPILGRLFKSKSESKSRSELLIFLTPKIQSGAGG